MSWYDFMIPLILSFCENEHIFVSLNRRWRAAYLTLFECSYTNVGFMNMKQILWAECLKGWKTRYTIFSGASRGDIEILEYLEDCGIYDTQLSSSYSSYNSGYPSSPVHLCYVLKTASVAVSYGNLNVIEWLSYMGLLRCQLADKGIGSDLIELASEFNQIEIVQWLVKGAHPITNSAIECASERGNLEILKILLSYHENPFISEVFANAVRGGHLHILQWLDEQGYTKELQQADRMYDYCNSAVFAGRINILEWLRFHKCRWSSMTGLLAAQLNNIDILKWALSNGCPRHIDIVKQLIIHKDLEAVKWCIQKGIPRNHNECIRTALHKSREIYDYLLSIENY